MKDAISFADTEGLTLFESKIWGWDVPLHSYDMPNKCFRVAWRLGWSIQWPLIRIALYEKTSIFHFCKTAFLFIFQMFFSAFFFFLLFCYLKLHFNIPLLYCILLHGHPFIHASVWYFQKLFPISTTLRITTEIDAYSVLLLTKHIVKSIAKQWIAFRQHVCLRMGWMNDQWI